MRNLNLNLTTKVNVEKLLGTLKTNRDKHSGIVLEARKGYVEKAKKALSRRLVDLQEGRIVALEFRLQPPLDYTSAYDTVIQMLEWTEDRDITLSASEFRKLVEDEWDWMDSFLTLNSGYSASAREYAATKGLT